MIKKKDIEKILQSFSFNDQVFDLLQMNYIGGFSIKDAEINCVINITTENQSYIKQLSQSLEQVLLKALKVSKVNFVFTGAKDVQDMKMKEKIKISIAGVKKIILVSSGKGGVGKSTVAFYLSLALADQNYKVGLVDADIYGPSVPTFTKMQEKPQIVDNYMVPHMIAGVKINSIGYLIEEKKALVWRGPMIVKALHQLLYGTKWDDLDFLIVDMPPGTGDIHLTIAEKYKIDGALLITTPQELAIADVARIVDMYKKLNISILGMVENMSYFIDSSGHKNHIFGDGKKLESFSKSEGIKLITAFPIEQEISKNQNDYIAFYRKKGKEMKALHKLVDYVIKNLA